MAEPCLYKSFGGKLGGGVLRFVCSLEAGHEGAHVDPLVSDTHPPRAAMAAAVQKACTCSGAETGCAHADWCDFAEVRRAARRKAARR